MRLYLDETPLDVTPAADASLNDVLALVNQRLTGQRRVVIALGCEGREVPAGELQQVLERPAAQFNRVDIRTEPQSVVAGLLLDQAYGIFGETEEHLETINGLLAEGQTARGMELLAGDFRLWQQAHEAVIQAVRLGEVPIDDVHVGELTSTSIIQLLRDKLVQIKESLEARDFVMLGDILQYEIGETITKWKQLIEEIGGRITPADAG
jgi:hypothetical protein